jgi:hypothetical protein
MNELVQILQASIGPVILISGVGLLLLSMTNRLARVIDRSRELAEAVREAPPGTQGRLREQLDILARRASLLRMAIACSTLSVLCAALLVIALFLSALFKLPLIVICAGVFMTCMLLLIASLVMFLRDINLSLAALKLELGTV